MLLISFLYTHNIFILFIIIIIIFIESYQFLNYYYIHLNHYQGLALAMVYKVTIMDPQVQKREDYLRKMKEEKARKANLKANLS